MRGFSKNKIRKNWFALIFAMLILYFIYHSFYGNRGFWVFLNLNSEYTKLQNELDFIRAKRLELEQKVNLLKEDSLDLDVLEERVKDVLPYAKENEEVYFFDDKK